MQGKEKGRALEPVALGYAEGGVEHTDLDDPFLCKLGGKPVWLDAESPIPSHSTVVCEQCGSEMLLLVQSHVPLNDSPYDRVMYIWACNRRACSGRPGATRAVRAHILNTEYALKLVHNISKKKPNPQSKDQSPAFSFGKGLFGNNGGTGESNKKLDFGGVWSKASTTTSSPSTGSDQLFTGPIFGKTSKGATADNSKACSPPNEDVDALEQGIKDVSISSTHSVDEAKRERAEWPESTASVQAMYLTFETEQIEKSRSMDRYQSEIDQALELASVMGDDASTCRDSFQPIKSRKASKKKAEADSHDKWADEIYERAVLPKGTDSAFSRFATVVGHNSEQVMRYQYGGVPLLYSMQDSVAKMLVASKSQQSQKPRPDTKAKYPNTGKDYESEDDDSDSENDDSTTTDTNSRQIYSTKALPRCTFCGGQRTFECQLMPALLTELPLANNYHRHHTHLTSQRNNSGADSSVQKRLVGSQLLQSLDLGVEFGTMMVFVCENDCHDGKTGLDYLSRDAHSMAKYAAAVYYEELVLVQQEVHID